MKEEAGLIMDSTIAQAFQLATQYHTWGQHTWAEQQYRSVVEKEPTHAEAWHRLGLLAQQRGDLAQAVEHFRRAVACGGTDAAHWNNLGVLLTMIGNTADAVAAYEQALELRPDYAEAHNNLGTTLERRGQMDRAVECHRHATRCKASYVEAYDNLGTALKGQGKSEEAAAAYRQALALKPDFAVSHNNLGIVLQEQGNLAAAMESYRRALRLQPNYADASNNLATALKEQGMFEESVSQYRATLKLQPDHALAYYNLSQFVAEGRYDFAPDEIERLRMGVIGERVAVLDRSLFAFTLATVAAQQGAADEAFAYYRQANELRRRLFREANRAFDPQKHRAFVDRIIGAFDRDYFRRVQGWGADSETPVFVIGMPRSGSTLIEQILASHPQVHGAGELRELPELMRKLARNAGNADPQRAALPLPDQVTAQKLADAYLNRLTQIGGGAVRVIDKELANFLYLGAIATLFPRARIIHCRRSPLDIGVSCYFQNFQHLNFAWSLEDIGVYYAEYEKLMAHWRQVLPVPIHEVRYEDLIANQEKVTRSLVSFCGLDWSPRCLAFYDNPRAVRTTSTLQVRKPLSKNSIGRWKRYRSYLDPLVKALGPIVGSNMG